MKRFVGNTILSLALAPLAFGQPAETNGSFEAADVHTVVVKNNNQGLTGPSMGRGVYQVRYATLVDLITAAYGVPADRIVGGPSWIEYDTFDIAARPPTGVAVDTAKPMLQALLADRFKLVTHNDTRGIPAYALKAGKRNGLKPSDPSSPAGCTFVTPPPPAPGEPLLLTYKCRNMTMAAFADGLRDFAAVSRLYLSGRGVVDQTELKGAWDFDLQYSPRNMGNGVGPTLTSITLSDGLERIGLRLEPATVPLPVIVVDSASQKPTPNAPNIAELLHMGPPPTEFEAAEIKPTDPDYQGTNIQIQPGGRVNVAGAPMKLMIERLWNVQDDMLAGLPKWAETERFNIVAKAPATSAEIDTDELIAMLKSLLIERFGIKLHTEERQANAYTLTAVKPRLKKADPNSRTRWKEGPAAVGRDPRDKTPALSRLVTVENMTMAQFAEKLQIIAPGYIHSAVLDATSLEGGWDFALNFSPVGLTRAAGAGGPGGSAAAPDGASDPNGAVSLLEAIEKQLGLKLQPQKRPIEVLVIDHIEQKPLDN